jgi:hypothetical protein
MMPNRLAGESSPYLRQHAANAVEWRAWNDDALSEARMEDKPVFLSIGYSSCHWCHVMAHESFEDEATAALLNERFVCIKVDREERPDLDALYMRAVTMMTGRGGWPLTVFLTPSLKPFYGGTYFPKDARFGMPAFKDILVAVSDAYSRRRGEIEESADNLFRVVARSFEPEPGQWLAGREAASMALKSLLAEFDEEEGGFGHGPKFPQPPLLWFLLDEAARLHEPDIAKKVFFTLRKMARGGVRDQIGGGFHRYSVDGMWRVPHFEKMLYDNAQLASLYFRAHLLCGDGEFQRVGEEVLRDIERCLKSPDGGYSAALDADSDGEEGRFYLWTPSEIEEALGEAEAKVVCPFLGLAAGHSGDLESCIPRQALDWAEGAEMARTSEPAFRLRMENDLERLRRKREARVYPGVDTNVLTDWNALAATTFFDAFMATGENSYREKGEALLDFIWNRLWDGKLLFHVWDGSAAKVPGFLADYAYLAKAHWSAFEATGTFRRLVEMETLLNAAIERFHAGDGRFYSTGEPQSTKGDLLVRIADAEDGVLPSPLGVIAHVLWNLERVAGGEGTKNLLEAVLRCQAGALSQRPGSMVSLAAIAAASTSPTVDVVVAAPNEGEGNAFLKVARGLSEPRLLVLPLLADRVTEAEAQRFPMFRGRRKEIGVSAYVCAGGRCFEPAETPARMEALLLDALAADE